MINIYFFPKESGYYYFDKDRVIRGAPCWEGELPGDYTCIVSQTGETEGHICLFEYRTEVITAAIANNNCPDANELMAELMKVWVPGSNAYTLPYVEHGVSFDAFDLVDDGSRHHGPSFKLAVVIKIVDMSIYVSALRDLGVKILSPDIVLYCDVAVEYQSNMLRGIEPCYYDYAEACNYNRKMFMSNQYDYAKRWDRSDEGDLHPFNPEKRPMIYYNYDREQMLELLYSGTGRMRQLYTKNEAMVILGMRGETLEYKDAVKLSVEDGKALAEKRAKLHSSEGGFKDLAYPRNKLTRTVRLAFSCTHSGETTTHHQDISELTIGEYNDRKAKFQVEGDPIAAMAILCGCKPAVFKSYFKTTKNVVWKVELQELLSWSHIDDVTLTVLENLE